VVTGRPCGSSPEYRASSSPKDSSAPSGAPPATTVSQGRSAGMSSPGASLPRWSASTTTAFAALSPSRRATADGAKAVNSGTCTVAATTEADGSFMVTSSPLRFRRCAMAGVLRRFMLRITTTADYPRKGVRVMHSNPDALLRPDDGDALRQVLRQVHDRSGIP